MKTHLVFSDRHAYPGCDMRASDYIASLILDLRPDVVIDNGDGADMGSLCSYDRNTRDFVGRNYKKDVEAANEANDRIWSPVRTSKKKMPRRITTIGNHDYRISRAIDLSPELEGAISYNDLQLDYYYNDIVHYDGSTPGCIEVDGIYYAHYLISGIMGRAIGGEHHAHSIISKQGASCVVGHSHTADFARRSGIDGRTRQGLVTGLASYMKPKFAGSAEKLWWRGVVILHNVDGSGDYDPEFVSLNRLENLYG